MFLVLPSPSKDIRFREAFLPSQVHLILWVGGSLRLSIARDPLFAPDRIECIPSLHILHRKVRLIVRGALREASELECPRD